MRGSFDGISHARQRVKAELTRRLDSGTETGCNVTGENTAVLYRENEDGHAKLDMHSFVPGLIVGYCVGCAVVILIFLFWL